MTIDDAMDKIALAVMKQKLPDKKDTQIMRKLDGLRRLIRNNDLLDVQL